MVVSVTAYLSDAVMSLVVATEQWRRIYPTCRSLTASSICSISLQRNVCPFFLHFYIEYHEWIFCTLSASVVQRTSLLCEADSSKNDMPLQTFMDWYLRNIHFFYIRESIKYSRFHLLSCIFGDVIIFRGWYASITSFSSYSLAEKGPLLNQTGQFWDNVI